MRQQLLLPIQPVPVIVVTQRVRQQEFEINDSIELGI